MDKVENLKKVTLRLEAGTTADHLNLTPDAVEYEFIFGIGPDGMCPFEYELINKPKDEILLLQLNKEDIDKFAGHLRLPVLGLFEKNRSLYLKVTILKIEQPDSKEVIKALAALTSHAEGCGCGCGC